MDLPGAPNKYCIFKQIPNILQMLDFPMGKYTQGRKLFREFTFFSLGIIFWIPGCAYFPRYLRAGTFYFVCHLQHFGAGTFHFACYAQHFRARTVNVACYLQHFILELSFLHAICSILKLESCILLASWICAYICNILELEVSIWHAISKLLLVVDCEFLSVSCGFLFVAVVAV